MSEADSSPENIRIPEHWKFKERNDSGLKVRQIDLDQRFLAFDLHYDPNISFNTLKYGDYFFDDEGNNQVRRIYFEERIGVNPVALIDLVGDQEVEYIIKGRPEDFDYERTLPRIGIAVYFDETVMYEKERGIREFLGGVSFVGQRLDGIVFDRNFATDPSRRTLLWVPEMYLDISRGQSDIENWGLDTKLKENEELRRLHGSLKDYDSLQPQKIQNGAVYLDKNGHKIFQVQWKIEEDELEPSKGQFAVVSQSHIPSGLVKTLRAPLRLDMGKVKEAVFARPPYSKDDRGRLVVPWTEIGRTVGTNLSYSYPPPTSQK
jgi:hypothetical protein